MHIVANFGAVIGPLLPTEYLEEQLYFLTVGKLQGLVNFEKPPKVQLLSTTYLNPVGLETRLQIFSRSGLLGTLLIFPFLQPDQPHHRHSHFHGILVLHFLSGLRPGSVEAPEN